MSHQPNLLKIVWTLVALLACLGAAHLLASHRERPPFSEHEGAESPEAPRDAATLIGATPASPQASLGTDTRQHLSGAVVDAVTGEGIVDARVSTGLVDRTGVQVVGAPLLLWRDRNALVHTRRLDEYGLLSASGSGRQSVEPRDTAITTKGGRFTLTQTHQATHLVVSADGYAPDWARLHDASTFAELRIELYRSMTVRVVLSRPDGRPPSGFEGDLVLADIATGQAWAADGGPHVFIGRVGSGRIVPVLSSATHMLATPPQPQQSTEGLELRAEIIPTTTVTVVNASDDVPVRKYRLSWSERPSGAPVETKLIKSDKGECQVGSTDYLNRLGHATHIHVRVAAVGFEPTSIQIPLRTRSTIRLVANTSPEEAILAQVLGGEHPKLLVLPPPQDASPWKRDALEVLAEVIADERGLYLSSLPQGTYFLLFDIPRNPMTYAVSVPSKQHLVIDPGALPTVTIIVEDIPNRLRPVLIVDDMETMFRREMPIVDSAPMELAVAPGQHRLSVFADGNRVTRWKELALAPEERVLHTFRLGSLVRRVHLVLASGSTSKPWKYRIKEISDKWTSFGPSVTADLPDLGFKTLETVDPEGGIRTYYLSAGVEDVRIELSGAEAGVPFVLRTADSRKTPLKNAQVLVQTNTEPIASATVTTDEDGNGVLPALDSGPLVVSLVGNKTHARIRAEVVRRPSRVVLEVPLREHRKGDTGQEIYGRITVGPSGAAVRGAHMFVYAERKTSYGSMLTLDATASTNANGAFVLQVSHAPPHRAVIGVPGDLDLGFFKTERSWAENSGSKSIVLKRQ